MTLSPATTVQDRLLRRDEPGYEAARLGAVFNGRKPSRRPAAILVARDESDVQAAVALATAEGWRVSIRSGGHSWIGNGVRDDTLLIDLSALDEITIDTSAGRATIQPAARAQDLHRALDSVGLVFPAGHYPTVGLGGFLLGGGYGWNSRTLGPACMSIEAVDVVLADGSLVYADDETHPDLMWAVRGAGPGFFAIVTRYYLRAYPAYDEVLRSVMVFPEEMRDEVLAWSYEILPETSSALEIAGKVTTLPGHDRPVTMLVGVGFTGDESADQIYGAFERAPFRDRAIRIVDRAPSSLPDLWAASQAGMPEGKRYAVDGVWTNAPAEVVLEAGRSILTNIPTPESFLFWMLWGDYPTQDNASWSTQGQLYFSPNAVWTDPADDLRMELWAHHALNDFADHQQLGIGTQFSDANPADRPDHGMEPDQLARLEQIRAVYDPTGLVSTYMAPAESSTALGLHLRQQ